MDADGNNYRSWDELMPDVLGLIFRKLPLDEILDVVPAVCRSWANVVRGPYCWREIDIEDWSRYRRSESVDRMLLLLLPRTCSSLHKLSVYGLSSITGLSFIADHAQSLQVLRLPRSEISDSMVQQVAGRLSALTFLDLSYCTRIGAPALKAFGENCKNLTGFHRNMHPWDVVDRLSQDDEAFAIASTMPKLKHLELAYLMISTEGIRKILTNCNELELLDLRGCWNVKLDQKFLANFARLRVVGPLVVGCCEGSNGWEGSDPSNYLAWDFMDDFDIDDYALPEVLEDIWMVDEADIDIDHLEPVFDDGDGMIGLG